MVGFLVRGMFLLRQLWEDVRVGCVTTIILPCVLFEGLYY